MTHETLTAERALQLLREVVAERPEFAYRPPVLSGCVYIDPDTREPSCLVGHVLIRAGWDPADLEQANQTVVRSLPSYVSRGLAEDAAFLLQRAQEVQDRGFDWGTALAVAEEASR